MILDLSVRCLNKIKKIQNVSYGKQVRSSQVVEQHCLMDSSLHNNLLYATLTQYQLFIYLKILSLQSQLNSQTDILAFA